MTDRYESRASTHADDCWSWGPAHYECAKGEIERLRSEAVKLRNIRADAVHECALANIRAELLAEALKEIRSRSAMNLAMNPNPFELTAMLGDIHQIADAAMEKENNA